MPKENEQLEAMLAEVQQEAQQRAGEAAQLVPEPEPSSTPEPKEEPPKEAAKPAAEPEDDEPESVEESNGFVPRQAFDRERHRRTQWKEKFARADGELVALRRQLEEAQKQRQPAPPTPTSQPQQFTPPPDFNQDPGGFLAYMVQQNQKQMLNERLNTSEAMARERLGDEKLDAYVADFRTAAEADPSLWQKLYSNPHPYGWLTRQMDTWRMHRDIGNDPAAYRARIIAEERAKWEAEVTSSTSRTPPASPAANLPPSLANVRSVASRSEPAFSGPPSDADVLAAVQQRKGGTARW